MKDAEDETTCPVCGHAGMEEPPVNYAICSCCGTEFGYHDFKRTHAELRQKWIAGGAKWWSVDFPPPAHWSPVAQLIGIGYECTEADLVAITPAVHEDFGDLVATKNICGETVGAYRVTKPLVVATYENRDGYTSIIDNFGGLHGCGQGLSESVNAVLEHLAHDRRFYGNVEEGRVGVIRLRELLQSYLILTTE